MIPLPESDTPATAVDQQTEKYWRIARWLAGLTLAATIGMVTSTPGVLEAAIAVGMLVVFTAFSFADTEELLA